MLAEADFFYFPDYFLSKWLGFTFQNVLMFKSKKYDTQSLITSILKGGREEEKAISFLIDENYGKIKTLILQRNGSEPDAEDIFQEALSVLILNIRKGSFKGDSTIHTYLYAICKGMWYKRFRKYSKESEYQSGMIVHDVDESTPEVSVFELEQKQLLHQLFDRLRDKCKELLLFWGMSYAMDEIAEKLEFSNAQVAMNKKNKCLKQLRKLMDEDDGVKGLVAELNIS